MTTGVEAPSTAGQPLSTTVRVGYSLGSLVTGAFGTVPGLLLLPYLTDNLGVAAGAAGLLVLLPKAWDVVVNPLAGRISDRTHTRWGARRPYLIFGGVSLAVLFALMFAAPFGAEPGISAAYVAVVFLFTATAFAFFQVPYVSMPAEMTDDYAERTRMMTWRVALLATAILVSGAGAPWIVDATGGGIAGHRWMGVFVASLMILGCVTVFVVTAKAPLGSVTASEPTLRGQLRIVAANRPFRVLVACFVAQAAGVSCMLAGVNYFADHVLHDHSARTLLFLFAVSPALVVMPLWRRIGDKVGKLRGYVIASVTLTAATLILVVSPFVPTWLVYAFIAIMGIGYAGQQLFGLAMLPDCIALDTARTGKRQAGVFTGVWTAGETLGLALGPGIFGAVLQMFDYSSSTTGTPAPQSALAEQGVLLGFTLVPAVIVGLALVFLRNYSKDLPSPAEQPQ
ncbi:Na+/melibiose symporter-like transporter [Allocatelliglobosispora scoriae]|uniref:Na+/melibiose symporter-like transporter n=1 Tax=Allocatelliglobosispora scoriae TaxID=643052 RepID=A0A841BW64_9ACTN|nr:MFS transporter [Allocatelliglobosispora scoriae]MBB5871389.1 Na+/melibiose symporter-like transporter [Allocatelliglobosispora scoriae]